MFKARHVVLMAGFCLAAPVQADAVSRAHVMGGLGCTLGPEVEMAPFLSDSTAYADLRAFADTALVEGRANQQGDWTVLNADLCTIRVPDVTSSVTLEDPEAQAVLSSVDAYPEDRGCFLETDRFTAALREQRGFTEDEAMRAYFDMVAVAVSQGDMTFFSDDPLRTPPGVQSLVGDCADVPKIDLIRYNQSLLLKNFDDVVRGNAARVVCAPTGPVVDFTAYRETLAAKSDGRPDNVFGGLELHILAMTAGWVDGYGASARGTPRPPICSHGD